MLRGDFHQAQWKYLCSSYCPFWGGIAGHHEAKQSSRSYLMTFRFRLRVCKNVFQCDSYSKPDWKPRFYAKSTSADVLMNFRFNVEARTSILATRFYTLWAISGRPCSGSEDVHLWIEGVYESEGDSVFLCQTLSTHRFAHALFLRGRLTLRMA